MELLAETQLSEGQLPLLRTARTCGEQLSTVINDILDLTKIQERRIEITSEEICFRELLEDLMDITVFSIGRRKIELILDYEDSVRGMPPWSDFRS
jgi:signal transduction histidine kinase